MLNFVVLVIILLISFIFTRTEIINSVNNVSKFLLYNSYDTSQLFFRYIPSRIIYESMEHSENLLAESSTHEALAYVAGAYH
jgi:hypothetical protein